MTDDFAEPNLIGLISRTIAEAHAALPPPLSLAWGVTLGAGGTGHLSLAIAAHAEVLADREEMWGGPRSLLLLAERMPAILEALRQDAECKLRLAGRRPDPAFSAN